MGKLWPVLLLLVLIGGCMAGEEAEKVSFQERINPPAAPRDGDIRIAVAGVISPREAYIYYEDIFAYVSEELGRPVRLVQRESYQEINDMIRDGRVDGAFVCSGAYVEGHDIFGMELLVAPVAYGETVYYSYIIVPADSPARRLEDLRGKRFAFTDPMSNTGKLAPAYMLALMNETPAGFFGMTIYTYNHDKSIEAVADHLVDGAAVDSLIYRYLNDTRPGLIAGTRIIEVSKPCGIPPLAVGPDLDPELKDRLGDIFLHMHEDPAGRDILAKVRIDRFTKVNDSAYDFIREMRVMTQ